MIEKLIEIIGDAAGDKGVIYAKARLFVREWLNQRVSG
jgi:hypothetical protein